ncbi:MAG: Fe-S cluster assembly ATPase SufC [Verrucomicrobia bacterium]|nr:Fe-S cluster assembly ATPase SufC [Verrucomicrobiota bacterium]MCH8510673.1 Fe-S cluster assembly ATPase SufC [Kiritimatiellia bacterium]
MADLEIKNLHAEIDGISILKGVNLEINKGEVHALMGPNGSGKSTLSSVIMGHPDYEVTEGDIVLDGESILEMDPEERAKAGLFLCFQYPVAVPGVSISNFLKKAMDARHPEGKAPAGPFLKEMRENMAFLEMEPAFANRGLNEGFSGGEKKRMEILQMMMFKPGMVIMDETDSGLDIDALQIVAKGVNKMRGADMGLLVITHYERILTHIAPDRLHILMDGRVVMSGGPELVTKLEEKGYDWVREETAATA